MSQPHQPHHLKAPTPAQLNYLRALGRRTGTTFKRVHTVSEASAEIKRLKTLAAAASDHGTLFADARQHPAMDAARVRDEEIDGYGSTATWKERA